jgi:hypothetical protein
VCVSVDVGGEVSVEILKTSRDQAEFRLDTIPGRRR